MPQPDNSDRERSSQQRTGTFTVTAKNDQQLTLMVVHAHPDDEASQTGGILARYSQEGVRTVLVTCTDGGQGDGPSGSKPGQSGHDPGQVAAMRSAELKASAHALGISELIELGYPDSGMPESPDDVAPEAFARIDGEPVVKQLEGLLQRYRPDVLVTYPPNGLYSHPDHLRTHELTMEAFERVKRAGGFYDQPDDSAVAVRVQPTPRLYYIALSISRLKSVRDYAVAAFGPEAFTPPLDLGVDDAEITTEIDIADVWTQKRKALKAHASQADAAAILRAFDTPVARVEEYIRAYPQRVGGERDDDFFADLRADSTAG